MVGDDVGISVLVGYAVVGGTGLSVGLDVGDVVGDVVGEVVGEVVGVVGEVVGEVVGLVVCAETTATINGNTIYRICMVLVSEKYHFCIYDD